MSIELNQATFRRLVQLYLLSIVASVVAFGIEYVVWTDFIDAFDKLLIERFGEPSDLQLFFVLGFMAVAVIVHIVAIFQLSKFRPWSRSFVWISLLVMLPVSFVPGFEFAWTGPLSTWAEWIGMALFGAILLLAYSQEHGEVWFRKPAKDQI